MTVKVKICAEIFMDNKAQKAGLMRTRGPL